MQKLRNTNQTKKRRKNLSQNKAKIMEEELTMKKKEEIELEKLTPELQEENTRLAKFNSHLEVQNEKLYFDKEVITRCLKQKNKYAYVVRNNEIN